MLHCECILYLRIKDNCIKIISKLPCSVLKNIIITPFSKDFDINYFADNIFNVQIENTLTTINLEDLKIRVVGKSISILFKHNTIGTKNKTTIKIRLFNGLQNNEKLNVKLHFL